MSEEGLNSNQQLGLETVVGMMNIINLGFYTPDQPIPTDEIVNGTPVPTSGQGCNTNYYFLVGSPFIDENLRQAIPSETIEQAWLRHEITQLKPDYGYKPSYQSYIVHVLRTEVSGAQTWITTVFQQGGN